MATQCTVTVAGFKASGGQEVAVASFTFTPPENSLGQVPMIHAVLPDLFHTPLYNVTMIEDGELNSIWIGDFTYNVVK